MTRDSSRPGSTIVRMTGESPEPLSFRAELTSAIAHSYTPILITAPQVMANFLRFLLLRDVFPRQKSKIKHAATLCELAKSQRECLDLS